MATNAANQGTDRKTGSAVSAINDQTNRQVALKSEPHEFPCNGPTGSCVLELGHPGNHWRDSPALHFSKAQDCSICRRVHGKELIHASE